MSHCGNLQTDSTRQQISYHFGGSNYGGFVTQLVENKNSVNHCEICISSKVPLTYKYMCHIHSEGIGNEGVLSLSPPQHYKLGNFLPFTDSSGFYFLISILGWFCLSGGFFFCFFLRLSISFSELNRDFSKQTAWHPLVLHTSAGQIYHRWHAM